MLRSGDIVIFEGFPHRVIRVSDCRAIIRRPRRKIVIQTRAGQRRFYARGREISISANSDSDHGTDSANFSI